MLIQAIRDNNIGRLVALLNSQPSPSPYDLGEALIVASQLGNLSAGELLLSRGVPANYIPTTGDLTDYSPLYAAALFGHPDLVRLLLQHGAAVNLAPNSHGTPPITAAVDYEADTASQVGETPQMSASAVLLEAGANPNIRNSRGQSALDLARVYNYQEAIQRFTTQQE